MERKMDYTILGEITPYNHCFLFHIFPNDDKIYLENDKTTIFVWRQSVDEIYHEKGIKDRIRVEICEDKLGIRQNAYEELTKILKSEIIGFEDCDFVREDILICADE